VARLLASSYRIRSAAPAAPTGPVLWPRWLQGADGRRHLKMVPIPPERIPPGWQGIRVTVRHRLATCEEADCIFWLGGWSEVITGDGRSQPAVGRLSVDEAAATYGFFGPASIPPQVIAHPPGTPCGRPHKVPADLPPVYQVNGRTVLWNEFEDSLAGGWQQAAELGAGRG